ncbi:LysM peptidoglycan-binding domain-containing protein [Flavobacterium cerinum]|uniref:LysM domain-containing protein n=1 Tax=Flavobacterium cerinum TaxID=2502784 RepID=A0A3S3QEL5_9FLAO|nr:LysM peptidoglycan-binding domain-containing protein [Flavobacterium cerinum]RWX03355.1 LysM domain-containing protein [Flavobacterium cerinum]
MTTIIVEPNQSLYDIAIERLGSVLALFDLAYANNLSPTAVLKSGQELIIPESLYKRQDVINTIEGTQQKIATALTKKDLSTVIPVRGIGVMVIEESFIVG